MARLVCHQCQDEVGPETKLKCKHAYCDRCLRRCYEESLRPSLSDSTALPPTGDVAADLRAALGDLCYKCRGLCNCATCIRRCHAHVTPRFPPSTVETYAHYALRKIRGPLASLLGPELREAAYEGVDPRRLDTLDAVPYVAPNGNRTTCDVCRTSIFMFAR